MISQTIEARPLSALRHSGNLFEKCLPSFVISNILFLLFKTFRRESPQGILIILLIILPILLKSIQPEIVVAADLSLLPDQTPRQMTQVLLIRDITFTNKMDGKEVVAIHANRRFTPKVFALERPSPRIVIDIPDTDQIKEGLSLIPVQGRLIWQIRTHLSRDPKSLRIVLDVSPDYNHYKIDQIFFEGDSVYVFEVTEKQRDQKTE